MPWELGNNRVIYPIRLKPTRFYWELFLKLRYLQSIWKDGKKLTENKAMSGWNMLNNLEECSKAQKLNYNKDLAEAQTHSLVFSVLGILIKPHRSWWYLGLWETWIWLNKEWESELLILHYHTTVPAKMHPEWAESYTDMERSLGLLLGLYFWKSFR